MWTTNNGQTGKRSPKSLKAMPVPVPGMAFWDVGDDHFRQKMLMKEFEKPLLSPPTNVRTHATTQKQGLERNIYKTLKNTNL